MSNADPLLSVVLRGVGVRWCTVGVGLVHRWCISIAGGLACLWEKCTNLTDRIHLQTPLYNYLYLYRKRVGVVGVGEEGVRCMPVIVHQRGLVYRWCRVGARCA